MDIVLCGFSVFIILLFWSSIGAISGVLPIDESEECDFFNPVWIYNHRRVNYFGASLIGVLYNFVCPLASIYYWIKKLCTVGRK